MEKQDNDDQSHLDNLIEKATENLEPGGPDVDMTQVQGYALGMLEDSEAGEVKERIHKWQNWWNAYWQTEFELSGGTLSDTEEE